MIRFDPRFIEDFSREASGLMKAIRCVQSLESYLPPGFPEPSEIKLGRKPYDLLLEWSAEHTKHAEALKNRITNGFRLDSKWYDKWPTDRDFDRSFVWSGRVRLENKASLNLYLQINYKHLAIR